MHANDRFRRGTGAVLVELFLGPLCPYSALAFGKIDPLLELAESTITVQVRVHPQPWNPLSSTVARCIWAATVVGGDAAAFDVMRAVYDDLDAFDWTGSGMEKSTADIIRMVEEVTGLKLRAAFETSEARNPLAWSAKYSRQNGVHGSPTFAINGVIAPSLSSGQDPEEWAAIIRDVVG